MDTFVGENIIQTVSSSFLPYTLRFSELVNFAERSCDTENSLKFLNRC